MNFRRLVGTAALLAASGAGLATAGCDDSTGGAGGGGGTASKSGGVKVQISGEDIATDGLPFPLSGEVAIADGWQLDFTHVLVSIDHVSLSENPDLSPSDQSQTGKVVATLDGPWIVDLHKEGTEIGAGGEGKAVLLGRIENQNKSGGASFDTTARYAFGFKGTAASSSATRVNLDAEGGTFADEMVAKGYSVLYVGKATFKGTACMSSDPTYDYAPIPTTFDFALGFASPTTFSNCQNQENEGQPFDGEEYQRGIAVPSNTDAVAQITMHLEHPLFTDVVHDSALFFDHFAAQLVGKPMGTKLTLEDLVGLDPTAVTDGADHALPWRVCDATPLPPEKQMKLGTGSLPVSPTGDPKTSLRDLKDFVTYVQSTQGHLNGGEGLCYVSRDYPSPP